MRYKPENFAQSRRGGPPGAFTIVEIMIVVVILGILAAVVLPKFSNASHTARENVLKDDLRYLRTQIVVFKAQHHDTPPGYPGGVTTAAPTSDDFIKQMTNTTDERCNPGAPSPVFCLGPYLSKMPPNPLSGFDTIKIVPNGSPMPAPDGSTGWIYKPQTLEIIANQPGTDNDGVKYSDY